MVWPGAGPGAVVAGERDLAVGRDTSSCGPSPVGTVREHRAGLRVDNDQRRVLLVQHEEPRRRRLFDCARPRTAIRRERARPTFFSCAALYDSRPRCRAPSCTRICAPPSAICARRFPTATGASSTRARAYPDAFVKALTDAGYLAALIPEEYGGSGLGVAEASVILEEINRSGGNAGACHAQMYTMGTLLRHGSDAQKREYLPKIATRRAAAAGVRRQRADDRLRHDAAEDDGARAKATATSSAARRSGFRAPNIPICCCSSCGRRRSSR